jgi:WD40 repeat protein/subtilisin-like proprotein convertase family protein
VERAADRRLVEVLRAKRLCCVFGPPAIGKSSLLLRAARALRSAGVLVAMVNLRKLTERDDDPNVDGWLRLIADRIAAELDLGVDVAHWWSSRDALGEHTLVEFFWEVVLTNTTAPIVVLVDDVDAVLELPFAADFLDAVSGCYERRRRESDFARLNFALAGCTSRRLLAAASPAPLFAEAELIEPKDFDAEQSYRLAVAFGGQRELAQALMDRICVWTGGHPYLTQRVARGVARKGGRLEDVERVVREQLLAPGAADKDPVLSHVRAWLGEPSRPATRAMRVLHNLAARGKAARPADAAVAERLWLSGAVLADDDGALTLRNRIIEELVAARWLKARGGSWRWVAAAAALLAALAVGGYWYTQQLPAADIETLTSVTANPDAAEAAYRRLRALPGFAERADELWLEALGRQSRAATALAAAVAADTRLRELPGQGAAADRLLSEFWLRRSREQAHAEQRDAALLLAQRAAALPGADPSAAAYLAELVGEDYARLERTLRLGGVPEYWHVLFPQATIVSIDGDRQALRTPLGPAAGTDAFGLAPARLTALRHAALTRELAVEGEGTAGEFELSLSVQHAAVGELLVTLRAPSGAEAAVSVPAGDGAAVETVSFDAARSSPLALLADEGVGGTWQLTIVDRAAGNTGQFGGWALAFGDEVVRDDPPEPIEIPDPQRVEAVNVRAVGDRAVAWPVSPGAIGTVSLWDLGAGQLAHDFTFASPPREVALDMTGTRVLAATERALLLWDAVGGSLVARVATQTEFVLPPVFSADGGYVAIAERVDGASPLYSVLRSADAALVTTFDGSPDVEGWELGPGGRYFALQGPDTVVRILEGRRGVERARFAHPQPVERLLHSVDGSSLITIDRAGSLTAWPLAAAPDATGRPLGRTADVGSVSASPDGSRLAYARGDGAVTVLDVASGVELYRLRLPRSTSPTATQLSADGARLVTQSGATLKSWALPPKFATPADVPLDAAPTALALDRTSDLAAVGLASGQLALAPLAAGAPAALEFFGHRGPVTAAALNASRGIAATGGNDGIVRVWDVATRAPTVAVMQPADAVVMAVALSADGELVASAAGRTVRVAATADGRVATEVAAGGAVTALALASTGAAVAVADDTGVVVVAPLAAGSRRVTIRVDAPAGALAFTADGNRLAVGDASGAITLIDAATGETTGAAHHWSQPVHWLEPSPDGSTLLVATDSWLHALATATPALLPTRSKLVTWPAAATATTAISSTAVGFAGAAADGSLTSGVLDLGVAEPQPNAAALVARDWQTALALRLNDNGELVPLDR